MKINEKMKTTTIEGNTSTKENVKDSNEILNFFVDISWPIVTLLIFFSLLKPISKLILSLRSLKWRDAAAIFEMDESDPLAEKDEDISNIALILRNALSRGPHSYDWIREHTVLSLSDDELDDFIKKIPTEFERTRIIRRDKDGKRIKPGKLGMALLKKHP